MARTLWFLLLILARAGEAADPLEALRVAAEICPFAALTGPRSFRCYEKCPSGTRPIPADWPLAGSSVCNPVRAAFRHCPAGRHPQPGARGSTDCALNFSDQPALAAAFSAAGTRLAAADPGAAIAYLERALVLDPTRGGDGPFLARLYVAEASRILARTKNSSGINSAKELLERAVALDSSDLRVLNSLASTEGALGRHAAAAERFAEIERRFGPNSAWHYPFALSLLKLERLEEARSRFSKALDSSPESNGGRDRRSEAEEALKRLDAYAGLWADAKTDEAEGRLVEAKLRAEQAAAVIKTREATAMTQSLDRRLSALSDEYKRRRGMALAGVAFVAAVFAAWMFRGARARAQAAARARDQDLKKGDFVVSPSEVSGNQADRDRCREHASQVFKRGLTKKFLETSAALSDLSRSFYSSAFLAAGDYETAHALIKGAARPSSLDQHVLSLLRRVLGRRREGTLFMAQEIYAERLELANALSGLGLGREACGMLDGATLSAAWKDETDAYVAAEVFDRARLAGQFLSRLPQTLPPESKSVFAAAFGKRGCHEAALTLLQSRGDLVEEDYAVLIAAHAGLDRLAELEVSRIPLSFRVLLAEAFVENGKEEAGLQVLTGMGRANWGSRGYAACLRSLQRRGRFEEAAKTFEEARGSFKVEEAPEIYYLFALFCERQADFERAKGVYRELLNFHRQYRDAQWRLENIEGLSPAELSRASTALTATALRESLAPSDRTTAADVPPAAVVAGRYQLIRPLGVGGMGIVYRARDSREGKDVALKKMRESLAGNPLARKRFLDEARTLAALSHPAIVAVHGTVESAGEIYISMELIEGETLYEMLAGRGRLLAGECLRLAREVCAALVHAHAKGIVHRDIKPGNLMLDRSGKVKVMDFGVAVRQDDLEETAGGRAAGTPAYMAPEQHEGRADPRADLFALGATFYELLTGRLPFAKGDLAAMKRQELYEPLSKAVPKELRELIGRCLKGDPEARPHSASACLDILRGTHAEPAAVAA